MGFRLSFPVFTKCST